MANKGIKNQSQNQIKKKEVENNKRPWIGISNKTVRKPSEARKCSSVYRNQSMLGTRL